MQLGFLFRWAGVIVLAASAASTAMYAEEDLDSEPLVFESIDISYSFNNDGTGKKTNLLKVRLQSDGAAQEFGQLLFPYLKGRESFSVDRIAVFDSEGSLLHESASEIKDLPAPVTTQFPSYTDLHIVHATAPPLARGNILEVQTSTEILEPEAPGQFWMTHAFTTLFPVISESLTVSFPKKREVRFKSVTEPEVTEAGPQQVYRWTHTSKGEEKEEDEGLSPYETQQPDVQLSSFLSWSEVGSWASDLLQGRGVPDPTIENRVRELIADAGSPAEKIERIYNFVAREFRYLSISYGVGRYQPHFASEVLSNGYGDCKDKHSLLAAMLLTAGFESKAVLIGSSTAIEPEVPSPGQFNHMITMVPTEKGSVWLDSTSQVTPYQYLSQALIDKNALVIDGEDSRIVRTPERSLVSEVLEQKLEGEVDENGTLTARVVFELRGDDEFELRQAFMFVPKANWTKMVFDGLEPTEGDISNLTVGEPTNTDQPLRIEYDLTLKNFLNPLTSEQSVRFPLRRPTVISDEVFEKEWLRRRWTTNSQKFTMELQISEGVEVRLPLPVDSTWEFGNYSSEYSFDNGTLRATRHLVVDTLPSDPGAFGVLRSAALADAKQTVSARFTGDAEARASEASLETLENAAMAAWRSDNYATAVDLYQRITEQSPEHDSAWYYLGRCYSEMGRFEDSIETMRKHLEVKPYDDKARKYIGWAFSESDRNDEAIEAYLDHLKFFPLDDYALAEIGRIHTEEDRCGEATQFLERAIAVDPDDTRAWLRIGECAFSLERDGRAKEVLSRLNSMSNDDWELHRAGYSLLENGFAEESLPLFEHVVEIEPEHKAAFNNYGRALKQLGRFEEALVQLDRQIEISSRDQWAHLNRGLVLVELGRLDAAWDSFDTHLDIDADDVDDRITIFRIYIEHDQWERALAALEPAVEAYTYVTHIVRNAAWQQATDGAMTLTGFSETVQETAHPGLATLALSGVAEASEGLESSVEILQQLVDKNSEYPSALSHLGTLLFHLDRRPESKRALEQALKQDGTDMLAHRGLGLLAAGRNDYKSAQHHLGLVKAAMGEEFPDQDVLDFVEGQVEPGTDEGMLFLFEDEGQDFARTIECDVDPVTGKQVKCRPVSRDATSQDIYNSD